MVLEKLFAGVANTFLGRYIENIDSKDMSFGLGGIILSEILTFHCLNKVSVHTVSV